MARTRYRSLDIFRGVTIFFMIIVNSSGNWATTYKPLLHAPWHGFTPTDLVFPSFLFAVGASMAIVFDRPLSLSQSQLLLKSIKRGAIIFLIGFLLLWFPYSDFTTEGSLQMRHISSTRIMGVLQRIGLAYILASIIIIGFKKKYILQSSIVILLAYWIIMWLFGDYSLAGNAAQLLDLKIIGATHLYKGEGIPFDPEGILSTFPSVVNILGGFLTVVHIRKKDKDLLNLALIGAALIGLGCLWHYGFPINKKIWTSSYVCVTVGINILMLLALHQTFDLKERNYQWGGFFEPMGKNPLLIYLLSSLGLKVLLWLPHMEHLNYYKAIYHNIFKLAGDYLGAFLFALTWTLMCCGIAFILDHKKLYLRI